jgi:hypothetical protein
MFGRVVHLPVFLDLLIAGHAGPSMHLFARLHAEEFICKRNIAK